MNINKHPFALPIRQKVKCVCLDLMMVLNDQMNAEGIVGQPEELSRRYHAVLSGVDECPLMPECERYRRAMEQSDKSTRSEPAQLKLWET